MQDNLRVLRYYPYRTGFVRGATFPREQMKSLEEYLFAKDSRRPDNHTCFLVEDLHYHIIGVMFSDLSCVIGDSVEERKW